MKKEIRNADLAKVDKAASENIQPASPVTPNPFWSEDSSEKPVSVLEWIGSMLICWIPCLGIIMTLVWAFSKNTNKSKSNYFKASLIFLAIYVVVLIIMASVLSTKLAKVFSMVGM